MMFEFLKRNKRPTIAHPTASSIYDYDLSPRESLTAGAGDYTFQPKYGLPAQVIQGAGQFMHTFSPIGTVTPAVMVAGGMILNGQPRGTSGIVIQPAYRQKGT